MDYTGLAGRPMNGFSNVPNSYNTTPDQARQQQFGLNSMDMNLKTQAQPTQTPYDLESINGSRHVQQQAQMLVDNVRKNVVNNNRYVSGAGPLKAFTYFRNNDGLDRIESSFNVNPTDEKEKERGFWNNFFTSEKDKFRQKRLQEEAQKLEAQAIPNEMAFNEMQDVAEAQQPTSFADIYGSSAPVTSNAPNAAVPSVTTAPVVPAVNTPTTPAPVTNTPPVVGEKIEGTSFVAPENDEELKKVAAEYNNKFGKRSNYEQHPGMSALERASAAKSVEQNGDGWLGAIGSFFQDPQVQRGLLIGGLQLAGGLLTKQSKNDNILLALEGAVKGYTMNPSKERALQMVDKFGEFILPEDQANFQMAVAQNDFATIAALGQKGYYKTNVTDKKKTSYKEYGGKVYEVKPDGSIDFDNPVKTISNEEGSWQVLGNGYLYNTKTGITKRAEGYEVDSEVDPSKRYKTAGNKIFDTVAGKYIEADEAAKIPDMDNFIDPVTGKPYLSEQNTSYGYANRMVNASDVFKEAEAVDPNTGVIKLTSFNWGSDWNPQTGSITHLSPEQQRYATGMRDWISAKLRKESGAAIAADEFINEYVKYFPQPGDDAATIEYKAQIRRIADYGMAMASGYRPDLQKRGVYGNPSGATIIDLTK